MCKLSYFVKQLNMQCCFLCQNVVLLFIYAFVWHFLMIYVVKCDFCGIRCVNDLLLACIF